MPKGPIFSGEFKQKVAEEILNNRLSFRETAKKYALPNHEPVRKLERIYLTGDAGGLYVYCRGRKNSGFPAKLPKQVEDILAGNQQLQMEIDYLKEMKDMVFKEEQRNRRLK